MTPDEMRIAVCECLGWKKSDHFADTNQVWMAPNGEPTFGLPPLTLDLMDDALETLSREEITQFVETLKELVGVAATFHWIAWLLITSTKEQRAKSFLKVKGLWK